jgi:non-specific serine/threonine protein kinase
MPDRLSDYDAVRLFLDRVSLVLPEFAVTAANGGAVARICQRLDGIPLALEMAAARMNLLGAEQLAHRLDDVFRVLTGGSRTALPRQQTLRALIDWSYDLLEQRERRLFERLSVFSGGWTLSAAECVCADTDDVAGESLEETEVLDVLASLVQKSLVMMSSESAGESRYRMLGTIRQYARDRLEASGDLETRRRRHRDYFVVYAERAAAELTGRQQAEWFARLEQENDNLCAAMSCCEETAGAGNAGLCLAGALGFFWRTRGRQVDVRRRIETALAADCEACPSPERARALTQAGMAARDQGHLEAAVRYLRESLEVYRRLDDDQGVAASLNQLGVLARLNGNHTEAVALLEEALELVRGTDDRIRVAEVLNSLGSLALSTGEYAKAIERYEEALRRRRELGDQTGMGVTLGNLGIVHIAVGDFDRAAGLFEESLKTGRETGDHGGIAFAAHYLGDLARRRGDFAAARRFLEESVSLAGDARAIVHQSFSTVALARLALDQGELQAAHDLARSALDLSGGQNDRHGVIRATDILGDVAAVRGQVDDAQRLWSEADEERRRLGIPLTPTEQAERLVIRAR